LAAHVAGYLDALERIFAVHGTASLQGMQLALQAVTMFIARLYPSGNSRPVCLFAPMMGAPIDAQRGLLPPLFVDAAQKTAHPPKAARLTMLQSYAAATMSLLMELGESKDRAAAIVADTLEKGKIPFARRDSNPARTVALWREQVGDHHSFDPGAVAYREFLTIHRPLADPLAPERSKNALLAILSKATQLR